MWSFRDHKSLKQINFLLFFFYFFFHINAKEVIFAVNCGGDSHVDIYGIEYQKDNLYVGTASEHGKILSIRRVPPPDQILYQTERYHTESFAYNIPIKTPGDYVLVLKFSEVWFTDPYQKVFNVRLNDKHTVVENLDIYAEVGLGMAHDEVIPFNIKDNKLYINNEHSSFSNLLKVEFVKLDHDNPKINAIYVMRGKVEDVPLLPKIKKDEGINQEQDEEDEEEEENYDSDNKQESKGTKKHRRSVSELRVSDPYASEDTSNMILPVVVALAAFFPIVFCLCKL